jgi:hypothetical protein
MKIKFIILLIIILLLNLRLLYLYNCNHNNINKSINKIKLNNNHIIERFALGDPPAGKQWVAKGCFIDGYSGFGQQRVLPNTRGEKTPQECYAAALAAGDTIVGFQYGEGVGGGKAQCWTGPTGSNYYRYGPTTACARTNNLLGAGYANNIYVLEDMPRAAQAGKQWSAKGCFADSDQRAIPNIRGQLTPAQCYAAASAAGDPIVGFQFGEGVGGGKAECWTGPANTNYAKYGPTTKCNATNNQLGAGWANNVFVLEDIPRAAQAGSTSQGQGQAGSTSQAQAGSTSQAQAGSTTQGQAGSTTQGQASSTSQENNELPTSEIIVLNRKYNEPIQDPDITNIFCNDTNVCFSHLKFNYPKY